MTSKDIDNMEDAELDALLQGRGELADLLRTMPQAGPSAALDAAILADAEAALRGGGPVAANDAAIPEAGPRPAPRFLSRWKVPLAFAASVLVAVNMIGFPWFMSPKEEAPIAVETMVINEEMAAPPAAAPPPPPMAEPSPPVAMPSPVAPASPPAPAPVALERPQAAPVVSAAPAPMMEEKAAAPPAAARADIGGALSGMAAGPAKPAPMPAPAAPMSAAPMARQAGDAGNQAGAILSSRKEAEPVEMREARPQAAPAREVPLMLSKKAKVAAAPAAEPQADVSEMPKSTQQEPQAWLLRIERLLNAGAQKEAQDEWIAFRRAYPDYTVPKEQAARIDVVIRGAARLP